MDRSGRWQSRLWSGQPSEPSDDDTTPVRVSGMSESEPLVMVEPWWLRAMEARLLALEERLLVTERRVLALTLLVATFAGGASGLFDALVEVLSGR